VRRLDAHHHVWDLTVRDQAWTAGLPALRRSFGFDELRPSLERSGISGTVVVQTVADSAETAELLELAGAEPLVAGVVGWVDLTADDVVGRIAELRALPHGAKLVGLRHVVQDESDPRWLCRADVRAGLRAVGEAGLAFDLLVRLPQLDAAIETVRALREQRFILDHAGKPNVGVEIIDHWKKKIRDLAALDNTAVKLSGLVTLAGRPAAADVLRPYADVVLGAFGPTRVMFGSDWPVCLQVASYDDVVSMARALTANLESADRDAVFGGSAAAWYRLAEAG
jgi:L-fuconolactonase